MTPPRTDPSQRFERWGHLGVAVVLMLAFITGGGSSDRGLGDVMTQLLALPLVVWSMLALLATPGTGLRRAAIGMSLLIVSVLVIQLLPVSEGLWQSIAVRNTLADDLRIAGINEPQRLWSLSPLATERGLWSILPALSVFIGTMAMPVRHHRSMLLLVVALSAASLLLGFLQLGASQDSILNPFPQYKPMLNGMFASQNHQATALAISVVIIAALVLHDARRDASNQMPRWGRFTLIALAPLLFASLPLTGSRAVFLLAVLGLIAVPVVLRRGRREQPMSSASSLKRTWAIRAGLGLLAVGVVLAAVGWLRFDIAEEVRWSVAKATVAMGAAHAPLGAGVGSFIPWFEQAAPDQFIQRTFYNHAHNEYAQWWLESGVVGLALLLGVIALLGVCYPRHQAIVARIQGDRGIAAAAWLGCGLLLLHSAVDYPMRTPALMTVAGLLAGLVVAQRMARSQRSVHRNTPLTSRIPEPS